MATAALPQSPAQQAGVPFTRKSLNTMRALAARFKDLQKPLPDYMVVELALERMYHEYCLYDNEIQESDSKSTRLIKRASTSRAVLNQRYPEFRDIEVVTYRSRHKKPVA